MEEAEAQPEWIIRQQMKEEAEAQPEWIIRQQMKEEAEAQTKAQTSYKTPAL
jgi:hypothetical protein